MSWELVDGLIGKWGHKYYTKQCTKSECEEMITPCKLHQTKTHSGLCAKHVSEIRRNNLAIGKLRYKEDIEKLKHQLLDANAVIEFYGDAENYKSQDYKGMHNLPPISGDYAPLSDDGKKARAYLDKFGITKCDNKKDEQ